MSTLHKEYWELPKDAQTTLKENQKIKATISFNKDSYNWATSRKMEKGYRITVVPVEITPRENGIVTESWGAFTGFGDTLLAVERQSAKRLQEAIRIMNERKDRYLQYFIETTETI